MNSLAFAVVVSAIILVFVLALSGCKKDEPKSCPSASAELNQNHGVGGDDDTFYVESDSSCPGSEEPSK